MECSGIKRDRLTRQHAMPATNEREEASDGTAIMRSSSRWVFAVLTLGFLQVLRADVKMPGIFGDHMVAAAGNRPADMGKR